nr:MAG TPA: hypothetical protein [Caudoviricetes sp.]
MIGGGSFLVGVTAFFVFCALFDACIISLKLVTVNSKYHFF